LQSSNFWAGSQSSPKSAAPFHHHRRIETERRRFAFCGVEKPHCDQVQCDFDVEAAGQLFFRPHAILDYGRFPFPGKELRKWHSTPGPAKNGFLSDPFPSRYPTQSVGFRSSAFSGFLVPPTCDLIQVIRKKLGTSAVSLVYF
jgi:hypothetical protein